METKFKKSQRFFSRRKSSLLSSLSMLYLICISLTSFGQSLNWQQMYAPVEENITSIVQLQDNEIFAGTVTNGIYMYDGNNWQDRNKGLNSLNIQALAVHTRTNMYAGTVDGLYQYQQKDGSWFCVLPGENIPSVSINDLGHIYAGGLSKIFRSKDNGKSWDTLSIDKLFGDYQIELIHITSNGVIYTHALVPDIMYIYTFSSADDGKTWNMIWDNLQVTDFASNSKGHIYAAIHLGGIKVSTDNGTSWKQVHDNFLGTMYPKLLIDRNDQMFVGDLIGNILHFEPGSNTVSRINGILKPGQISDLLKDNENNLLIGTVDNGVFVTSNMGVNWQQINNGFKYGKAHYMFSDRNAHVFAGSFPKGMYKYSPQDNIWINLTYGGSSNYQFIVNDKNHIFMTFVSEFTGKGGLIRSEDNGETWEDIGQTLPGHPYGISIINGLAQNSTGKLFLMLSTEGIYESDDNGNTWQEITDNIGIINPVYTLNINSDDYLFAGSQDGRIFRSADNGNHWDTLSTGIKSDIPKIKSNKKGELFAISSYGNEMVYSTNNGNTWNAIDIKKLDSEVSTVVFDKQDNLYVATKGNGVFKSNDNGQNWTEFNQDLSDLFVLDMTYTSDHYIYCSTFDNGIFRTTYPLFANIENDRSENRTITGDLNKIYPNPVSNSATVFFSLSASEHIILSVYNSVGAKEFELLNEFKQKGNHEINFNTSVLSNGIYFVKLETQNQSVSKKIVVIHSF